MGASLWYGEGDPDDQWELKLGNPFHASKGFGDISREIDGEEGFEELESVPGFFEQDVTLWWLKQVKKQAQEFLRRFKTTDFSDYPLYQLANVELPEEQPEYEAKIAAPERGEVE